MKFKENNPIDNIMLNIMDEVFVEKGNIDYNTQLINAERKIWLELEQEKNYRKRLKYKRFFEEAVKLIHKPKK